MSCRNQLLILRHSHISTQDEAPRTDNSEPSLAFRYTKTQRAEHYSPSRCDITTRNTSGPVKGYPTFLCSRTIASHSKRLIVWLCVCVCLCVLRLKGAYSLDFVLGVGFPSTALYLSRVQETVFPYGVGPVAGQGLNHLKPTCSRDSENDDNNLVSPH